MNYFLICQDNRIDDLPVPSGITNVIDKNVVRKAQIQYLDSLPEQFYIKGNNMDEQIDYIERPLPLISGSLREAIEPYMAGVYLKPIVLADTKRMQQYLYWLIIPPIIDCLSDRTEFNKDGTLKGKLAIEREKAGYSRIFKVVNGLGEYIIIREEVAETVYKGGYIGIRLLETECIRSL